MKSTQEQPKHQNGLLISRKRPQSTGLAIASLVGFLVFLTSGLLAAAVLIDGVLNGFSVNSFLLICAGLVGYKLGRVVMNRCSL
ncbi:hypothetical protein [Alteromonas oceanisediminis]|uniref:hypothetical protein n=1 Tax=Alteromonas oceanisediminis TaxID=2836180 RepID=UPI001BDABAAF|nr:hypothetical protein [Alteromonas oceanisediminis]MBT0586198.1 hypothetical protein [Alteromonas oceanisediminis]